MPIAISLLAASYAMRGERGDLTRSLELGEEAGSVAGGAASGLAGTPHPRVRQPDVLERPVSRGVRASDQAKAFGGLKANSAEFLLRGAGMDGLALAGMGRYEEALTAVGVGDRDRAAMGRPRHVVIELLDLDPARHLRADEARERSQVVADRLGPSDFNMPWMNARADLIAAELLLGELGSVERLWPAAWDDAAGGQAWERWLVSGRLAIARAQLELGVGRLDEAVTWSRRALEMAKSVDARSTRRSRYRRSVKR